MAISALMAGASLAIEHGYHVETCPLKPEDFPSLDAHQNNAAGYLKVRHCVQAAIEDLVQRPCLPPMPNLDDAR
jgi:hypothetical protein